MIHRSITVQRGIQTTESAAEFVQLAMAYQSKLRLETAGHCVNPKSLLGVVCLGIGPGSSLNLTADGADEEKSMEELVAFFNEQPRDKP